VKNDVIKALINKEMPEKRPSKETLNHGGVIYLASGIDPYENTQLAYMEAYKSLGIDILNRVPSEKNVVKLLKPGESRDAGNGYVRSYLGLYDTFFRHHFPFADEDAFFSCNEFDLDYRKMINPTPHHLDIELINKKISIAGETGCYYYQYYNTLFMWPVEYLGWEVFMTAASQSPEEFDKRFMQKAFETSLADITSLVQADHQFLFLHDDLAYKDGPVFRPEWYDKYILPRYPSLWEPVRKSGKKVIMVADGNMDYFLPILHDMGVDGVMLENPATNFDYMLEVFGDRIIISGMDTALLTFGSPEDIKKAVYTIAQKTRDIPGFAICSPGGLHNNIPMENIIAYFDARVECGFTARGWKKGDVHKAKTFITEEH
jgi:uroporphyrinogen decarboxylase